MQSLLQTYVHIVNELGALEEGKIEIEIEGKSVNPLIGEEVFFLMLMLCTNLLMWVRQTMSGITDTKTHEVI